MQIITAWQHISPGVTVMGVEKCCISNRMDGTNDDDMMWNGSEEDGNVNELMWGWWRHWLWRWRQWHWFENIDRIWHTLCIKCMMLIINIFPIYPCILVGLSQIWINTFSFGRHVLFGGLSEIRVIFHLGKYSISSISHIYMQPHIIKYENSTSSLSVVIMVIPLPCSQN